MGTALAQCPDKVPELNSAPHVYLKHLEHTRGFTITDPRTGGFMWASEDTVREYIALGKVKPFGSRKRIAALHWMGEPMRVIATVTEPGAGTGGTSRPTRYSHNRETEENPQNCWTLVHLGGKPIRRIFLAVVTDCLSKAA